MVELMKEGREGLGWYFWSMGNTVSGGSLCSSCIFFIQVHRQLTGSSFLQLCGGKAIQRRLESIFRPRYHTDPVDAIPRLRLMANSRSKTMNWRLGSSYARLTELSVLCKDRKVRSACRGWMSDHISDRSVRNPAVAGRA